MTDEFLEFKHRSGITISIPRGLKKEERDQALASLKMEVAVVLYNLDEQKNIVPPKEDGRKTVWTEKRKKEQSRLVKAWNKNNPKRGSRGVSKGLFLK